MLVYFKKRKRLFHAYDFYYFIGSGYPFEQAFIIRRIIMIIIAEIIFIKHPPSGEPVTALAKVLLRIPPGFFFCSFACNLSLSSLEMINHLIFIYFSLFNAKKYIILWDRYVLSKIFHYQNPYYYFK